MGRAVLLGLGIELNPLQLDFKHPHTSPLSTVTSSTRSSSTASLELCFRVLWVHCDLLCAHLLPWATSCSPKTAASIRLMIVLAEWSHSRFWSLLCIPYLRLTWLWQWRLRRGGDFYVRRGGVFWCLLFAVFMIAVWYGPSTLVVMRLRCDALDAFDCSLHPMFGGGSVSTGHPRRLCANPLAPCFPCATLITVRALRRFWL